MKLIEFITACVVGSSKENPEDFLTEYSKNKVGARADNSPVGEVSANNLILVPINIEEAD